MDGKIYVKSTRPDLPPHPVDGALPKDGGWWPADQFTFRRIQDGDIEETDPPAPAQAEPAKPAAKPAAPVKEG
jgi:hypothetical protein